MKYFKYFFIVFIFVDILFLVNLHAFNIYTIGKPVDGTVYNKVWKKWFKKSLGMFVGIDESGKKFVIFKCQANLGEATIIKNYTDHIKFKMESILKKSIEWSDIAHKNHADTEKSMDCIGLDRYGLCKKSGVAFDKGQIGFLFLSTNKGKDVRLIISLVDQYKKIIKTSIYFDEIGMNKLLKNIQSINNAFDKAKDTASKQNLFK